MVTIIDDPYLLPLCTDDAGVVPAIAVAVLDGDIEYDVMVQVRGDGEAGGRGVANGEL